jgi:polyisoprenoid-binding protein YceI
MARYRIVPERSHVSIDARSSLHPIHSETDGLDGWLDLEVRADGRVDLATAPAGHLALPVDRLKAGNPLEDRELQRRIEARRHPTIDGDLTVMKETGSDGRYTVGGDLTFRGVTRSYQDQMTVELLDPRTVRLSGQSTFDVRDFGLEPPRILMLRVEPDVVVRVEITAEKEA